MKLMLAIVAAGSICAAGPVYAGDKPMVDAAVKAFLADNPQSAGLAIGIVRGGKSEFYNYGVANRATGAKFTADTLFPIASITKTFTGTLLADAQIEGKLKLDDDVRKYLDGDYPNLEKDGRTIRMADLVDHRSGLPFFIPDLAETSPDFKSDTPWLTRINTIEGHYTRDDFYADLHKVQLAGVPGQDFHYSNAGAMLAGYILERLYSQPYETLVTDKILKPPGMDHTQIVLTTAGQARLAQGYDGDGRVMPGYSVAMQGAGAVKSTTRDMVKYLKWQIAESDPAVKLSHQPQTGPGNYAAGLNWQMLSDGAHRAVWQTGNLEGYNAYCITEPELKIGMVVVFNEADPKANHAQAVLVNHILKGLDDKAVALP